jgi:ketosteroid isomerase-like protein
MTITESDNIINEVRRVYHKITVHSEKAQLDAFLSYYDDSPHFLSFSADGKMSDATVFRKLCSEYYNSLKGQTVTTISEKYHVIDANLVIVGWTGNILAVLKNGEIIKMDNYSITSIFKKIDGKWKIIHDHESALPPEITQNPNK